MAETGPIGANRHSLDARVLLCSAALEPVNETVLSFPSRVCSAGWNQSLGQKKAKVLACLLLFVRYMYRYGGRQLTSRPPGGAGGSRVRWRPLGLDQQTPDTGVNDSTAVSVGADR